MFKVVGWKPILRACDPVTTGFEPSPKQAARKNVGTHFNFVRLICVAQKNTLRELLTEALPYLYAVTTNRLEGKKIVLLNQGIYVVDAFQALLKKMSYHGPVGLQGCGIFEPSGEYLQRSIQKWRESIKSLELVSLKH